MPRAFVGFEAHTDASREQVRLFICRTCHVMEKLLVSDGEMQILERRDEVMPPERGAPIAAPA